MIYFNIPFNYVKLRANLLNLHNILSYIKNAIFAKKSTKLYNYLKCKYRRYDEKI